MVKQRKVWSSLAKRVSQIDFFRLNVVEEYNNQMNHVNVSDQLQNQYRPDHWMRIRKWWWAFFIWGIGVAAANA